jgi:hypothetical protein
MSFTIRPFRRFPMQCAVTYNAGPFQGEDIVWNLSCTGWRLSGDLPIRPAEPPSLTVTLPNEQRVEVPAAVVVRTAVVGTVADWPDESPWRWAFIALARGGVLTIGGIFSRSGDTSIALPRNREEKVTDCEATVGVLYRRLEPRDPRLQRELEVLEKEATWS